MDTNKMREQFEAAFPEHLERLDGCDKAYAEVWEKARGLQAEMDDVVAERDQLKAENEALRKDAERYRFVRSPLGTGSPLAIWNEGRMPLFSGMADAVVDELMAKEASHG